MLRRSLGCLACVVVLSGASPAWAQQKYVGGGVAYNIEAPETTPFGITVAGWLPQNLNWNIPFKPVVLVPRFTLMPDIDYWQIDADAMWDIPLQAPGNVHPYIGMGVGLVRASFGDDSETKPMLNFNAGLRFQRPNSKMQFLLESHYSSAIDYPNTMHLNFIVMIPFGD